ncbi:MAG: phenylacetate-CoA oxygenase subunit PaaC [Phycisphaerae bacterium]|jgi:ring-1,2-phenylacetyl-CoA epoxidase subunit PaaC|nr:phenylacetate-CoA oxygenase subunit PaaC [Phycisphaerae bacterium]
MSELDQQFHEAMCNVLLSIADDKLFLGHRNSDWTGIAPILEADIAFSSLAQDDIAHGGAFYELASELNGKEPNQIAFGRNDDEYLCANIVTKSDEFNWANAIARQFYCNVFDFIRFQRLSKSSWSPLANLARRICAEQAVHVDHITTWIDHLGKGTDDAKVRMQEALDEYAPYAAQMFEVPEGIETLFESGILADQGCFFTEWKEQVDQIAGDAGLTVNVEHNPAVGARRGQHDEDFRRSLNELQEVFNTDSLAAW